MTPRTPILLLTMASLTCLVSPACAQSTPAQQTLLVLDASGSMWGQIDGRSKIEIAREAVHTMLADWNGGDLGLMAYGHRRKGDCADIELLQAPAPDTTQTIGDKVDAIKPMGMTPISESVRQAAARLRSSEQKATVILVSDGEETCNADPCALGEELEREGVDFTAHVIGFDIAKGSVADRQLACLADRTGGRYLLARDASELNQALGEVARSEPAHATPVQGAQEWIPGHSLSWAGGHIEGAQSGGTRALEFSVEQTARDCQALCQADADCAGWHYEPTGSYFIDYPRCHLKGYEAPMHLEAQDEGWVAGLKPGAKLIAVPASK